METTVILNNTSINTLELLATKFLNFGNAYIKLVNTKISVFLKRSFFAFINLFSAYEIGHKLDAFDIHTIVIWSYYIIMIACSLQLIWSDSFNKANQKYYNYARQLNLLVIVLISVFNSFNNPAMVGTAIIGTLIEILLEIGHILILGH